MVKVTSEEKFDTSFGTAFIIKNPPLLKVGQELMINDEKYQIKRIVFPTRPDSEEKITVFV
jgi:hypothetical protein